MEKSKYTISKHRYYELKHFCLQYDEWRRAYFSRVGFPENVFAPPTDTTSKDAIERAEYSRRMHIVEEACAETTDIYREALFRIVTKSISPPRDEYMRILYNRFFWVLDKKRC